MGYVDLKRAPEHTARKTRIVPGWFPDPILGFLEAVDIRGNDVQGFWIKVRCPSGQKAGDYAGDGNIVACGPGGRPLSTQRLENFRDGLEDLWYARRYREKFGKDAEVPDAVVKSLREFTRDPKALQAWRDRMADLIEAKKGN